jgi:hypothetical protein
VEGGVSQGSTLGVRGDFHLVQRGAMPERKDNQVAKRLLDGGSKMESDDAKLIVKVCPGFLASFLLRVALL